MRFAGCELPSTRGPDKDAVPSVQQSQHNEAPFAPVLGKAVQEDDEGTLDARWGKRETAFPYVFSKPEAHSFFPRVLLFFTEPTPVRQIESNFAERVQMSLEFIKIASTSRR